MRLFRYKDFINESSEDIDSICTRYCVKNYTINEDGSIDVDDNVDLYHKYLTKIPVKFRNVSGDFNCNSNKLTSLEGCPERVGGYFYCSRNQLTLLEGCPQSVGGVFSCHNNQLTSLEGCPQSIGGSFYCNNNKIMDFKGFPEYYDGRFNFDGNPVFEILDLLNFHTKSIYWIMEHDVIQGNKVILQRLEAVAYELNIELPENIKLDNYEII